MIPIALHVVIKTLAANGSKTLMACSAVRIVSESYAMH